VNLHAEFGQFMSGLLMNALKQSLRPRDTNSTDDQPLPHVGCCNSRREIQSASRANIVCLGWLPIRSMTSPSSMASLISANTVSAAARH
jgi:hypothetical protein